jgi:hypothetical protein
MKFVLKGELLRKIILYKCSHILILKGRDSCVIAYGSHWLSHFFFPYTLGTTEMAVEK